MPFYFHMQAFKNESMYSSTSLNTVCRKNNCYIPPPLPELVGLKICDISGSHNSEYEV
jgi:hypothetical protein